MEHSCRMSTQGKVHQHQSICDEGWRLDSEVINPPALQQVFQHWESLQRFQRMEWIWLKHLGVEILLLEELGAIPNNFQPLLQYYNVKTRTKSVLQNICLWEKCLCCCAKSHCLAPFDCKTKKMAVTDTVANKQQIFLRAIDIYYFGI